MEEVEGECSKMKNRSRRERKEENRKKRNTGFKKGRIEEEKEDDYDGNL
jgi:hypothetical protein